MTELPATELPTTGLPTTGLPAESPAGRGDDTTLIAGVPGPSGTGERTDAGADPAAPTSPAPSGEEPS